MLHPIKVALHFRPHTQAFWLALAHDSIEDGYAPNWLASLWPALDAITRRDGEVYQSEYIPRCAAHPVARAVKIIDLLENYKRAPSSLRGRYERALRFLARPPDDA